MSIDHLLVYLVMEDESPLYAYASRESAEKCFNKLRIDFPNNIYWIDVLEVQP